ncbi:hypothetical protein [Cellulomonas denverensis]|uniref:Uncharacterized protein n=1 Tax=Cellulomonas denverensis TaxID=264297 RepID=A0A7X6R0T1_9CELL|nr:hypothetical protein [Cellulomonas denverensis]NKY24563.1 hypothetical protein [Cellulomonas denverensis]GIG27084.1 hypothetical protein Cde04nite_33280 [Cellulomonas denverensis]
MSVVPSESESARIVLPARAPDRLRRLGVSIERLGIALDAGDVAARQLDEFAPATGVGLERWIHTVQSLRQGLAEDGWTIDNPDNVPLAVDPTGTTAIRVASGTSDIGRAGGDGPQRKHPKPGAKPTGRVSGQLQFDFDASLRPWQPRTGLLTWWLLYYRAPYDELRAELSWAVGESAGELTWGERVLLPPRTFGPDVVIPADAGDDEVEFDVRAR